MFNERTKQRTRGCRKVAALKLLSLALAITVSVGCRDHLNKSAVNGLVKFKKGGVIDRGMIEFSPIDSEAGNQTGARIFEGKYEIPREKGLRPGKYIVRVSAPSALLSGQGGPGGKMVLPEERVSEKYNVKSKVEVEITSHPMHTFDFEVE